MNLGGVAQLANAAVSKTVGVYLVSSSLTATIFLCSQCNAGCRMDNWEQRAIVGYRAESRSS